MLIHLFNVTILWLDHTGEKRSHWSAVSSHEDFTCSFKDIEHDEDLKPVMSDIKKSTEHVPEAPDIGIVRKKA